MSSRGPRTYVVFSTKFHLSKVKSGTYEYRNFTSIREMYFLTQRGLWSFDMSTEMPRWAANVGFFSMYVHMNTPPCTEGALMVQQDLSGRPAVLKLN